ncbi:uncharacterized protein [Cicer arietinum]|uniref:Uncharacterized protein LOC105852058 n=1 Tax=Cicer arietinum TaxID=3827 RepID=A0A1S3E586_CICAR|nr:uncharacterized protein LOC105852058 [Cicer arietinum]
MNFMYEGCQLNLAYFVKSVMFESQEAIGLPYAKEVSQILEHFGVDFSDEVMYTPAKENMLDMGVLPSMWIVWNEQLESFVHKGDYDQPSDAAQEYTVGPSNAAAQADEDVVTGYMKKSRTLHYMAAKRVLRHIKETNELGLLYPKNSNGNEAELADFIDVDWCGDKDERKSTTGY